MTLSQKLTWLMYSITILLGAFLMFLIQPLAGKIITPQYGGVSQVWCLCLLFFQLALLGGYGLTFVLSKLRPLPQVLVYLLLMIISVFYVQVPLGEAWAPDSSSMPSISLVGNLTRFLALPCVLLSTVSVMMQYWFQLTRQGEPYHLYSVSNVGSVAALLAYPVLIEPYITVGKTIQFWLWGYQFLVVILIITIGLSLLKLKSKSVALFSKNKSMETVKIVEPEKVESEDILKRKFFQWVFFSALGSILLVSYSSHLTHDIAPIPLLWVVPLLLYLLTFVFCFSQKGYYQRSYFIWSAHAVFIITGMIYLVALFFPAQYLSIYMPVNLMSTLVTLFIYCMLCHGELYACRPAPPQLPGFYLSIALGGALGGFLVNFLAPVVFDGFDEFYWSNFIMLGLSLFLMSRFQLRLWGRVKLTNLYIAAFAFLIIIALGVSLYGVGSGKTTHKDRNFYGALRVVRSKAGDSLSLVHGTTVHGRQMIETASGQFIQEPTVYYSRQSPIGVTHDYLRRQVKGKPLKIGVIGLGVGTVATYGKTGDRITFYEVDPKIEVVAKTYFHFLGASQAVVNVILGDGRLKLKAQKSPQFYDILIVDAFNGDSIPVHLLTREAFQLYSTHIKPDGLLVVHISNRFLDLHPVVNNIGMDLGLHPITLNAFPQDGFGVPSTYSVLSKSDSFVKEAYSQAFKNRFPYITLRDQASSYTSVWTDDFSNVFSLLWQEKL